MFYIMFVIFAVGNIVTAVFVDSAMQANNHDRQVIVQEEMDAKKDYIDALHSVFEELYVDGTGFITLEEFETHIGEELVVAYFNSWKLDVSDARTLFTLLDVDGSNEVSIDEFIGGCFRLQGES